MTQETQMNTIGQNTQMADTNDNLLSRVSSGKHELSQLSTLANVLCLNKIKSLQLTRTTAARTTTTTPTTTTTTTPVLATITSKTTKSPRQSQRAAPICTMNNNRTLQMNATNAELGQAARQRRRPHVGNCGQKSNNKSSTSCAALALATICLLLANHVANGDEFESSVTTNNNNNNQPSATSNNNNGAANQASSSIAAASLAETLATAASNANYEQQQSHQSGAKAKKIQIVYIKVPLAKLRPSISSGSQQDYGSPSAGNSTGGSYANKGVQQYGAINTAQAKSTQQQLASGSQQTSGDEQQQQIQLTFGDSNGVDNQMLQPHDSSSSRNNQQQSFLIPMALVQTSSSDASSTSVELPNDRLQALNSAGSHLFASHMPFGGERTFDSPGGDLASELINNNNNAYNFDTSSVGVGLLSPSGTSRRSPMQLHQQRLHHQNAINQMMQQDVGVASAPQPSVGHGFMSSFLLGEKEKMTAAAIRLHQRQQQMLMQNNGAESSHSPGQAATLSPSASAQSSFAAVAPPPPTPIALSTSTTNNMNSNLNLNLNPNPNSNSNSNSNNQLISTSNLNLNLAPQPKPGGLMPASMVPLSRMPDNAIGQAYGAAVGNALPVESGSPASLMSSSSTTSNTYGTSSSGATNTKQQQQQKTNVTNSANYIQQTVGPAQQIGTNSNTASATTNSGANNNNNNNNNGGNAGNHWDANSSSGSGSSASYGANGQGQHASGSQGNNYQQLGQNYAGTGHYSGFGSGINTFGASGAFSDYPGAQLANQNNNFNHHQSQYNGQQQQHQSEMYAGPSATKQYQPTDQQQYQQRLKQAKKTIIPIVVQVEHAILESAAGQAMQKQQQQQQQQQRGNKYGPAIGVASTAGRANRQLGGNGKRGNSRYNSKSIEQQNAGGNNKHNQLYGAATNDIAQYGDIPPGAQFINAANAQEINKITAQINAENAANAAAVLAQADASLAPGAAYVGRHPGAQMMMPQQQQQQQQLHNHHQTRPNTANNAGSQYAANLQSAASVLLANTHPVIQAAASNGLASVSKLGAKLGEMMSLPSMSMPSSIAAFPGALTNIAGQVDMNKLFSQAMQQVAKEHPAAHAIAKQVAQQAGIQFPDFESANANANIQHQQQAANMMMHSNSNNNNNNNFNHHHQMAAAASTQQQQQVMSPQAQLAQNLKLTIGQNLQNAAQMMGISGGGGNQKPLSAQQITSLLGTNQATLSAALKQLNAISPAAAQLASQLATGMGNGVASAGQMASAFVNQAGQSIGNMDQNTLAAAASSLVPVQQQLSQLMQQQFMQQQQQQQQSGGANSAGATSETGASSLEQSSSSTGKQVGKPSSSFKTKFLSFFQPPKFISNLLSWNDRSAAERNDDSAEGASDIDNLVQFVEDQQAAAAAAANKTSSSSAPTTTTTTTTPGGKSGAASTLAANTSSTISQMSTTQKFTSTSAAPSVVANATSGQPLASSASEILKATTVPIAIAASSNSDQQQQAKTTTSVPSTSPTATPTSSTLKSN